MVEDKRFSIVSDFLACVSRLARPSTCLSPAERYDVQKLAEVGKHAMRTQFMQAARDANGPVINRIFADAKPLTMRLIVFPAIVTN